MREGLVSERRDERGVSERLDGLVDGWAIGRLGERRVG